MFIFFVQVFVCVCVCVCVCIRVCARVCLTLFPKDHIHKHKQGQLCAGVKPYESTQIPKHTRANLKKKK